MKNGTFSLFTSNNHGRLFNYDIDIVLKMAACIAVFALFTLIPFTAISAPDTNKAKITFIKEKVYKGISQKGPWEAQQKGMSVTENNFLKTGEKARVELTMPDNSILRLSENTIFKLDKIHFPQKESRKFSAKLILGRMWAKIRRTSMNDSGLFETRTPTVVIGVRGTVYNVDSAEDNSADISVFEGLVGVGPPEFVEGGPREEIAFPLEITEREWEEIILNALQKLHISAEGVPGEPESFNPVDEERDEWISWNREMDSRQ